MRDWAFFLFAGISIIGILGMFIDLVIIAVSEFK